MTDCILSISIITYNQEEYIAQTLDSIINQKHDYKYEIVIGDDYSQDKTRKIISEYQNKYPEIIKPLFNEKNLGIIKNYFNVLSHCSGKYIMECAGDDYWLDGKISNQLKFMENNPECGLCYSNVQIINEASGTYRLWNPPQEATFSSLLNGNFIPAFSICFKKEILLKYIETITPLEKNWLMEDYPLLLYFSKESKIAYCDEVVGVYREIDDSVSHSVKDISKQINFTKSLQDVNKFFKQKYSIPIDEKEYTLQLANTYLVYLIKNNKYSIKYINSFFDLYSKVVKKNVQYYLKKLILYFPPTFKAYCKQKQKTVGVLS